MSVYDEFEEWREYERTYGEAQEAQRAVHAQLAEAQQQYEVALTEHNARVREAALTGGTVPDDLPQPSQSHALAAQLAQQRVIDVQAQRTIVLASIAARVEQRVAEEMATLMEESRPHAEALDRYAEDASELLRELQQARQAEEYVANNGLGSWPSRSGQTRPGISRAEWLDAVRDGTDLCEPLPTLGMAMRTTNVLRDDGAEEARRPLPTPGPQRTYGFR